MCVVHPYPSSNDPLWLRIQGPKASNNLRNEPSTSWTKMSASWDQPSKVGPHKLVVGCRPPPNSHVAPPMQARSPLQLVIDIEICLSWSSWEWWRDERNLVLHNSPPTFSLPMVFSDIDMLQVFSLENFSIVKLFAPSSKEVCTRHMQFSIQLAVVLPLFFTMLSWKVLIMANSCALDLRSGSSSTNSCSFSELYITTSWWIGMFGLWSDLKEVSVVRGTFPEYSGFHSIKSVAAWLSKNCRLLHQSLTCKSQSSPHGQ